MAKPDVETKQFVQKTGNGLVDELTAVQRQRLSGTVNALEQQGAAPGDAWTAAAAMQKQKDVPGYTPEDDEQDALNRVSQQAREQTPETEIAAISVDAALSDSEDATGSSSDGSGTGLQQERLQPTGQDPQQNAEMQSAPESAVTAANITTRSRSDDDSTEGDSNGDRFDDDDAATSDENAIAQDVLENARAYLDNAVAQGALEQPPGKQDRLRAENDRYVVERDSDGVVTLQNKETHGYVIGDGDGKMSATRNLSQTDQEAWRGYRQEQEGQHRTRQKQRQRRRREQTEDLEL